MSRRPNLGIGWTLELLDGAGRRRLLLVLLLTGLLSVAELAGVTSILPFMGLVSNPDLIQQNHWLRAFYEAGGFSSEQSLLVALGLLMLAAVTLANLLGLVVTWTSHRFVLGQSYRLVERLMTVYARRPHSYYLGVNTAELVRTLESVNEVLLYNLEPLLLLITRLGSVALILAGLFWADPVAAVLAIGLLGGAYFFVYLRLRRVFSDLGEREWQGQQESARLRHQMLQGMREARLSGREGFFVDQALAEARTFLEARERAHLLGVTPPLAMRTMVFAGLLTITLWVLSQQRDPGQAIPWISLYALAGYRLLPAFQQAFTAIARMRGGLTYVKILRRELADDDGKKLAPPPPRLGFERELALEEVRFEYLPGEPTVQLSLSIARSGRIGIVGRTGSGKSTVMALLMGLLAPTSGRLLVDGREVDVRAYQQVLGVVPQDVFLLDESLAHNVAFGVPEADIDQTRLDEVAALARIDQLVASLEQGWQTRVGERGVRLSGGERQRVGIARTLYHDPEILFFDEATAALDGQTEQQVLEAIDGLSGSRTIIMVAHRLSTVKDCDIIYLLEDGRIAASGTYDQLYEHSPLFRDLANSNTVKPGLGQTADAAMRDCLRPEVGEQL
ncbi:MAG: ABC transporter ATP-binding protein [Candidatus Eremiobacteraeota bacterium]|nr:ABC transporter ATP-binding protein [Candidatus Eremiobacteraeota bacterium]